MIVVVEDSVLDGVSSCGSADGIVLGAGTEDSLIFEEAVVGTCCSEVTDVTEVLATEVLETGLLATGLLETGLLATEVLATEVLLTGVVETGLLETEVLATEVKDDELEVILEVASAARLVDPLEAELDAVVGSETGVEELDTPSDK